MASETRGLKGRVTAVPEHNSRAEIPRRIFVSEYVCGGGWPEKVLSPSLAFQGQAMLLAIVSDLLHIPGCDVVTTWDQRLGPFPRQPQGPQPEVCLCDSTGEQDLFEKLCRTSDSALVIAPEFGGILAHRVTIAARETTLLGPDPSAVRLCSDKLQLSDFLLQHGIATIPTQPLNPAAPEVAWPFPIVIKPRDGAGSLSTFLIRNADELKRRCDSLCDARRTDTGEPAWEFIQQPFRVGEHLSAAVVIGLDGTREILPVCRQRLSRDGRFEYRGADRIPGQTCRWDSVASSMTDNLLAVIPGTGGYLGFDLIGTADDSVEIADINPRLTTGYLGWRMWTRDNIARRLLMAAEPINWLNESGQFRI